MAAGLTVLLYFANALICGLRGNLDPLKEIEPLCFQLAGFTFVSTIFESKPGNLKVPNLIQNLARTSVLFFLAGFFFLYVQNYAVFEQAVWGSAGKQGEPISGGVCTVLFILGLLCLEGGLLIFGVILKDVGIYVIKPAETTGKSPSPKDEKKEQTNSTHAKRR